MYTGGGPDARNWARSGGGVYELASERKKNPLIEICIGQSNGFGMRAADQQYVCGTARREIMPGAHIVLTVSRPSVFARKRLIRSPKLYTYSQLWLIYFKTG